MSRFNTDAIYRRLHKVGYIYQSDVTWLEKRWHKFMNDWRDGKFTTMSPEQIELNKINSIKRDIFKACPGEAHKSAWVDNCGVCAPRWNVIINPEKVKL